MELLSDLEERVAALLAREDFWRGHSPQRLPPLIQAGAVSGSGAAESVRIEQSQR
jgi:hypothetical protein